MQIWKINKNRIKTVDTTIPKSEKILEKDLENWILDDPSFLGEPLLIIGHQVLISEVGDRLDILAIDTQGNAVVIELKRGKLKDPVDMQALRYASYISKWQYGDFENQARIYYKKTRDFNFNEIFENFCSKSGIDETPDINSDQRIILVGSDIREKLGSVALWLREHKIDIKVIEVEIYRDNNILYVQPQIIIPLPVSKFEKVGPINGKKPWIVDGKMWHLEKRCGPKTKNMLIILNEIINDNFDIDGPKWNQKYYIAYYVGNYIWLSVHTSSSILSLKINIKTGFFNQRQVARQLNIKEFSKEVPLSEKFGLPSSVYLYKKTETTDRIILRIKEDFDIKNAKFVDFLIKAYRAFPS